MSENFETGKERKNIGKERKKIGGKVSAENFPSENFPPENFPLRTLIIIVPIRGAKKFQWVHEHKIPL